MCQGPSGEQGVQGDDGPPGSGVSDTHNHNESVVGVLLSGTVCFRVAKETLELKEMAEVQVVM